MLSEVRARARDHHGKFDLARCAERRCFLQTRQIKCAIGAPKPAFTVRHNRQVVIGAADSTVGSEFPQCLSVVPCRIGSETDSFAHDGEPAATAAGS